jgi:hypothetical protein
MGRRASKKGSDSFGTLSHSWARSAFRQRRLARRYQHWTEHEPEEDYARRASFGVAVAIGLFLLLIVLVVVGLVVAR